MKDLKRLFGYLGPYRRDLWLGAALVVIETSFELIIPVLMSDIIDVGVASGDVGVILQKGVQMAVCALLSLLTGLLYAALLFLVGVIGLWDLMYETLSIVLASVVISLLLGLPTGILISGSDRANVIIRPILDTMQTMPVFVYLIPAVLFFGLGKAPAVIATTIYAIVPVIRLTSHGIRQVDPEVVEAARSFGSTKWQCLFKVQIPQALPTIMTGVNQTLMMAMAMVVTCSMIGASGLGMEVLISVNRIEIGRGLLAGAAVVIVAILMDRLTQGWFGKEEKNYD